jgi:hypothetical protein
MAKKTVKARVLVAIRRGDVLIQPNEVLIGSADEMKALEESGQVDCTKEALSVVEGAAMFNLAELETDDAVEPSGDEGSETEPNAPGTAGGADDESGSDA